MKKTVSRLWAAILAFLLVTGLCPAAVFAQDPQTDAPWAIDGVYQIGTADELFWFASQVNGGSSEIDAVLTGDIDLENRDWTAIGNYDNPYSGTFDGQGYVISNLYIQAAASYQGLFGCLGEEGVVRKVRVSGSVTSNRTFMAGIAGRNAGLIENCYSDVTVANTNTSVGNSNYIGGIAGQNAGTIRYCQNAGSISGCKLGGIAGYVTAGGTVLGCYNSGAVTSKETGSSTTVGGVVGQLDNGSVFNCINAGQVSSSCTLASGYYYVGGISGQCSKSGVIVNCLNLTPVKDQKGLSLYCGEIYANSRDSLTVADSYYLADQTDLSAGAVAREELQSAAFVSNLNINDGSQYGVVIPAEARYTAVAGGYPTLRWLSAQSPEPEEVPVYSVSVSGTPKAGECLRATASGEDGSAAANPSYQWQYSADGQSFENISGANAAAYTVPEDGSFLDGWLRVTVQGVNSSSAVSAAVGPVEMSDSQKVQDAKEQLALAAGPAIREAVSLSLPLSGANGTAVSWVSSDPSVVSPAGVVTLPASGIVNVTLTATISLGEASAQKSFSFAVYSAAAVGDHSYLQSALQALEDSWFRLKPVFGEDTNVIEMVQQALADLGYGGASVSVSESDPQYIAANGDIAYFYKDPNQLQPLWFASTPVVFTLTKGDASESYSINAVIYWDADRVRDTLQREILSKVTPEAIRGDNASLDEVRSDLTLPKVADGKKWTLISWSSSDTDVLSIDASGQGTADTLFDPYVGRVKQGLEDQTVILTATFRFQYTSYDEPEILMTKRFAITVKGMGSSGLLAQMQQQLDQNYTADKLTYSHSQERLDPNGVTGDIQLLIPRNTGVENYGDYWFAVTSDDPELVEISGYRANVYRPLPGESARQVTLTVSMSHRSYSGLTVSKKIVLTVLPLEQSEIDREIALMEAAKANYFEGINNGANEDKEHILSSLTPFQEAVWGQDGQLRWIYSYADTTGQGIVPVSIDESRPSESWDRFYSSDKAVLSHENLLLTQPTFDQLVTVTSCLSSETYGRYAQRYPDNPDFQKLYRQMVSVTVKVPGSKGAGGGESGSCVVSFTLVGDTPHGKTGHLAYSTWLDGLSCTVEEGSTVMDVFRRLLTENGYAFVGTDYISSITTPGGETLAAGTNGPDSGWLYAVNGKLAQVYADSYCVEDGDTVLWFYTDSYRDDNRFEEDNWVADTDVVLPDYTAQWYNFRGSSANIAVTDASAPRNADEAKLQWTLALKDSADWETAVSDPIMVNNHIYMAVGNEMLMISRSGTVTARGSLADAIDYTCRPLYLNGKILVPLANGRLQALAADSLKTVWITEGLEEYVTSDGRYLAHQSLTTVTASNGYIYMGTACADWNRSYYGVYRCVEGATGKVVWEHVLEGAGYYWSGAVALGDAVYIAGDDGVLLSLNATTGQVLDSLSMGAPVRSTLVLYDGRVWAVSTDGKLHKITVEKDGTIAREQTVQFADYSTGTPAIYGGRVLIGGRLGEDAGYQGIFCAIDAETLAVVQTASAPADVKSAPLIAVDREGTVRAYFTSNTEPGALYYFQLGDNAEQVHTLYLPALADQNYCVSSVMADSNGTLYYTNDSGKLFSIGSRRTQEPETPVKPGKPDPGTVSGGSGGATGGTSSGGGSSSGKQDGGKANPDTGAAVEKLPAPTFSTPAGCPAAGRKNRKENEDSASDREN